MRIAAAALLIVTITGCAGGSVHSGGRLAKTQYLSALEAIPAPMRTGVSVAPILGLNVNGTITNSGTTPVRCGPTAFVLLRQNGEAVAPSAEFCSAQVVAPSQSTYFNATFPTTPGDNLQLRFEHGDGSYEVHTLIVPPG